MWWSKQAGPATLSFSPAFSSTGTIDSPSDAPARKSGGKSPYPSTTVKTDRAPKPNAAIRDDLRLDAIIDGPISLNCQRLTVGETAKATADVIAREVIVYGELHGHLQAAERIEIKNHGSVMGDLTTPRILIEDGAYFKGTVQIERRKKPRGATAKERSAAFDSIWGGSGI
jgi:cytoskeletal protein CcmA (bactofilin family)